MKALFRILLAAVGALALLLVCGVVYVTTFLDPNDLKPRLAEAVKAQTGLELSLDGPLSWSFYPHLGVSIEDASARLPNAGAGSTPFASVEKADVEVDFSSLLVGDVSVDGINVSGLQLDLERDGTGRGNWEQIVDHMAKTRGTLSNDKERPKKPVSPSRAADQPLGIDIASLAINGGRVHYSDAASGANYTLSELDLKGANVVPGQFFPLSMAFDLESTSPAFVTHVSLKSRVRADLANSSYTLENLVANTTSRYPELSGGREQSLDLAVARLSADPGQQIYQVDGVSLDGEAYLPRSGDHAIPVGLDFSARADLQKGTASVSDLSLTSDNDFRLVGHLALTGLDKAPAYEGQVTLAPFNLRKWLEQHAGATLASADNQALTRIALDSPIKGDMNTLMLSGLDVSLDDQNFNGQAAMGLDGRRIALTLAGQSFDLDRYLAPVAAKEEKTASLKHLLVSPAYAAVEESALVPVDWLRQAALKLSLSINQMTAKQLSLGNVSLLVEGSKGQHALKHLSADLYGGKALIKGGLDVRKAPIQWRMTDTLEGVKLEPLLADALQKTAPIKGTLAMNGTFTSQTNQRDSLLNNLDGRTQFKVTDGALLGQNLSQRMCQVVAAVSSNTSAREWADNTPFDALSGTFVIKNGIAHNDDFRLDIPGIRFSGAGEANLPTSRFDYAINAGFINTADPAACKVSDKFQKVDFPLHCQGAFSDEPGSWCSFDRNGFQASLAGLAGSEVKRKLQKEVERGLGDKTRQKINDKLGEGAAQELKNAINGLFK
ncbi:AsmA family protein [Larsenimonas rhizosphaerae]|uniref:AsmA family protein n=1 Tax=Larsenimonas rhizosphaerae TaxID=2944682 RepID=UPI00203401C6|nr:AsmA family protein [Larsenimonas rhizosphaerae]MCM2131426.1 AsmA family protein [Larsenimonas rhizosphaerae]